MTSKQEAIAAAQQIAAAAEADKADADAQGGDPQADATYETAVALVERLGDVPE